jgi:hypothetical protein
MSSASLVVSPNDQTPGALLRVLEPSVINASRVNPMSTHFAEIPISTDVATSSASCLVATLRMLPGTRTEQRGSEWEASCQWDGRAFQARARNGATYALCRELVRAGCPDQPLEVRKANGQLELTIRSIHVGAKLMVRESGKTSIRSAPYVPHPGDTVSASKQGDAISPNRLPKVRQT